MHGSLVVDSTGTQLTFVATGGVLAADTYQVTLHSGGTAFSAANGNQLDGKSDGTFQDYTNSFTVTTAPVVVSVPDFARGPSQAVNVPVPASQVLSLKPMTSTTSVSPSQCPTESPM